MVAMYLAAADRTVLADPRRIHDGRRVRVAQRVPLGPAVPGRRAQEAPAHQNEPLQQRRDLGIDPEQQAEIGERPDRQEGQVPRVVADRAPEELDRRAGREVSTVRPSDPAIGGERFGLGRAGLALLREQGQRRSRVDRHVLPRGAAECARDRGSPFGFAAHRRDAGKLAAATGEQVREAECVVDVAADVRVEENAFRGCRHGTSLPRRRPR